MPCFTACFKAKAREAIVFPPPVGTVNRKIPFSSSPSLMQFFKISVLLPLIVSVSSFSNHFKICFSNLFHNTSNGSPNSLSVFPFFIKNSVSKKSASTKQEYIILIKIANAKSLFLSPLNGIGSVCNLGISISSLYA